MIRRVVPGDHELLRSLRLRALTDAPEAFAATLAEEAAYDPSVWHDWAHDDSTGWEMATFIAFIDDQPTGIVAAYRDEERRETFHVIAMWVDPEYRRRSVGRDLLNAAEEWIRRAGGSVAELRVTDRAPSARRLYEHCGYAATGVTFESSHADGVTHHEMTKAL